MRDEAAEEDSVALRNLTLFCRYGKSMNGLIWVWLLLGDNPTEFLTFFACIANEVQIALLFWIILSRMFLLRILGSKASLEDGDSDSLWSEGQAALLIGCYKHSAFLSLGFLN